MMDRSEALRKLKGLIKKYHPDLCGDETLAPAYREITVRLNAALNRLKAGKPVELGELGELGKPYEKSGPPAGPEPVKPANLPVKVKDQGYAYYKRGINYYKNIHPDKFYRRNPDRSYELRPSGEQRAVLDGILESFEQAEHYFRLLVTDYPQSPWRIDAERKLRLLKKLRRIYEAGGIRESPGPQTGEDFVLRMGLKPLF